MFGTHDKIEIRYDKKLDSDIIGYNSDMIELIISNVWYTHDKK
jgi:hypothetical protein